MSYFLFRFLIFFIIFEIFLVLLIKLLKFKNIPWIITNKDEYPIFNKQKIKMFLKKTYDKELGWNWKPKKSHKEKIFSKQNTIRFGKYGERKNFKYKNKNLQFNYASFGDSFVFCRYSNNKDTWQSQLGIVGAYNGLNLGVGNYGLDQIYLKYKKTIIPKNIKTIYIGFVPETLSRCLCSWKHYHEFNNLYAFKPKFIRYKKELKLLSNPIENLESFDNITKIIRNIKNLEFFYKRKFLKYKLTFPYFFSVFNNPKYNFKLFFYSFLKILNLDKNRIHDFIIRENCIKNDVYFNFKKNNEIISKLMNLIKRESKKKKTKSCFFSISTKI